MYSEYDNEQFFTAYKTMKRSQEGLSGAGEWYLYKKMFPDLKDKTMLDLGCGYGWHAMFAIQQGAKCVFAIDASVKMIAEANKRNYHEQIDYQVCEITAYHYPECAFDIVQSNLALHYVQDLSSVYRNIYKTLKPSGIFIMNIEHPVFTSAPNQDWIYDSEGKPDVWPVDDYFHTGPRDTMFLGQRVQKFHHTLTQIVNGLIQTGFRLDQLIEVEPEENTLEIPGMIDELKRPMMLLIKATKI